MCIIVRSLWLQRHIVPNKWQFSIKIMLYFEMSHRLPKSHSINVYFCRYTLYMENVFVPLIDFIIEEETSIFWKFQFIHEQYAWYLNCSSKRNVMKSSAIDDSNCERDFNWSALKRFVCIHIMITICIDLFYKLVFFFTVHFNTQKKKHVKKKKIKCAEKFLFQHEMNHVLHVVHASNHFYTAFIAAQLPTLLTKIILSMQIIRSI